MATPTQPDPSTHAFALAADLRAIFGKIRRKVHEQGNASNLTPSQIAVVLRLEKDHQATTSGLARTEAMKPQSMARIVMALQELGFIATAPDPRDGRQTLLSLSATGQNWLREGRAARQDWLTTTIETRLTTAEQDTLRAAIALLERVAED